MRRKRVVLVGLLAAAAAVSCAGPMLLRREPPDPPPASAARGGPTDVTFLAASDLHFGAEGLEAKNRAMVEQMNALPGLDYPPAVGGRVARPLGVLIAGDLTDDGRASGWRAYEKLYGRTGTEGLLRFPVFECTGNHDRHARLLAPVLRAARKRHGGRLIYAWDWGNLHLVCLDLYPDADGLAWLARDLRGVGPHVPVVIFFHYSIEGPYSDWWSEAEKVAFAGAIEGYNVLGIFHGHYHGSGHYVWRGHDVFLIGSPRHSMHRFLAVHVTDGRMTVAAWNWDARAWDWTHVKAVRASAPASQPAP